MEPPSRVRRRIRQRRQARARPDGDVVALPCGAFIGLTSRRFYRGTISRAQDATGRRLLERASVDAAIRQRPLRVVVVRVVAANGGVNWDIGVTRAPKRGRCASRPRLRAATGTIREDTQGVCGDADNGFGLLYNWSRLRDGVHTVTAYADGDEFASVTVIVTTLGEEFLQGTSGTLSLPDFPTPGASRTLRWQQAQQNFVITAGSPQGGGTSGATPHILENPQPGSFQSGVGVISGWACEAQSIEISFDGGPRLQAGTGTIREDTQGVCGDTNNGFGLLYNWNRLGDGPHTVTAYADGVEFAEVTVTVTTLGAEFRRGLSREVTIPDFPEVGNDAVLQWQEAQQNFVISFAASTQRLVDVTPMLTLPAGGSLPNVEISSLHSETTAAVRASPEPSLLLAEDTGGTVLLALANLEGGLLGEPPGEVDVSIDSTAVVLVALAAGVRLPDVDRSLVDAILAHPQWPALVVELHTLFQADQNFLDQLFEHPDIVARIRTVATSLTGTISADVPPQSATPPIYADQGGSVLPDGVRHENFSCLPELGCSPWQEHAPWVWYGEAGPILLSSPFLAASEAVPGLTATGNPNFVDYALEVYTADGYLDWYRVPSNGSLIDKGLNSYTAYRPVTLDPSVTRVEFVRYRLDASSARAAALSFLNTTKVILSGVGLIAKLESVEKVLERFPVKKKDRQLAGCVATLLTGVPTPAAGTSGLGRARQALHFIASNAVTFLEQLSSCEVLRSRLPESLKDVAEFFAYSLSQELAKKFGTGPLGWILLGFEAANEVIPTFSSYVLPVAGSVEYHIRWAVADTGDASIACASESQQDAARCLPPTPTNLRVESTTETTITLAWDAVEYDAAVDYVVYQHPADGSDLTKVTQTAGLTATISSLREGERYCFRITAVAELESDLSAQICGTPEEEQLAGPTGLTATYSHTADGINYYIWDWETVEGEVGYQMHWLYPRDGELATARKTCSHTNWSHFASPERPPFTWTHYHGDYRENHTVCKAVVAVRGDGTRSECSEPVCGKWNHPTNPPGK